MTPRQPATISPSKIVERTSGNAAGSGVQVSVPNGTPHTPGHQPRADDRQVEQRAEPQHLARRPEHDTEREPRAGATRRPRRTCRGPCSRRSARPSRRSARTRRRGRVQPAPTGAPDRGRGSGQGVRAGSWSPQKGSARQVGSRLSLRVPPGAVPAGSPSSGPKAATVLPVRRGPGGSIQGRRRTSDATLVEPGRSRHRRGTGGSGLHAVVQRHQGDDRPGEPEGPFTVRSTAEARDQRISSSAHRSPPAPSPASFDFSRRPARAHH